MFSRLFGGKKAAGRILIVEDDAMLAMVLAESFKAENFKVSTVGNGTKVFNEAVRFTPDLILLDLLLPGLDGFGVLKQLKADSRTSGIPVVVVSNLSQVGDIKEAEALGADQYFLKANTKIDSIIDYAKGKLKK